MMDLFGYFRICWKNEENGIILEIGDKWLYLGNIMKLKYLEYFGSMEKENIK